MSVYIKDLGRKRKKGDGFSDGFKPLESLDLSEINDADEMLRAMSKTSFTGRRLGEAADVLYKMITDPDCFVVGTFSGAMTVAKMGLVITDMIEKKMLQAIVTTGALMAHGLVETSGMSHFKYEFDAIDDKLGDAGYDRVYDTLELEKNLDDLEEIVDNIFKDFKTSDVVYSRIILKKMGQFLKKHKRDRGVVISAYENKVPIYIPAFTDSELGLDFALYNLKRKKKKKKPIIFDPFQDLEHFSKIILNQKKLGIFTIGGGVPRNWAQQIGPYLDLIRFRIIEKSNQKAYFAKKKDPFIKQYKYGVRICPEPAHWGGLSGCTYSEGVSWGKFIDSKKGGRFAEVHADATAVWPLLIKGVMQRLDKKNKKIVKNFK